MDNAGRTWADERGDVVRAIAGAYIFGIPLLFTMEMWWFGESLSPHRVLALAVLALLANVGLAHIAGFRSSSSLGDAIHQSIDTMAIGIIAALLLLLTLNQIRLTDSPRTILAMVLLEAIPLSIGSAVARQVFKGDRDGDDEDRLTGAKAILEDIGATVIGGIFIGFSIAPTEEIQMIAAALTPWHVLAAMTFSLAICYLIVFASGFDRPSPTGPFHHPWTETALCYVVSLVVAFALLVVFDRLSVESPPRDLVSQVVVLAVPTAVGGAAGRLVI